MIEYTLPPLSGGLNLQDLPYKINDNQAQDVKNMWFKDRVLNKRFGQSDHLIGLNGAVKQMSDNTFNGYGVIHAGDSLYKWDITNATVNSITNGISNKIGSFFAFDDNLYYKDGVKYWSINTNFVVSEVVPKIPVVLTGCSPNLTTSTPYQDYNLIGSGFEVWYNADGTNVYTLPLKEVTNTVSVTVNGTITNAFTVDTTNGKVTFTSGPTNGGVISGVRITAYKDDSVAKNKIMNCLLAIPFGGETSGVDGGTRIFVSGNENDPNYYWRSDLKDPTYFPENQYDILDNNNQAIYQFGKQYGDLIVFKEKSIYGIKYNFDGTNVTYPTTELHSRIGSDMRNSVQLIDNRLVFANTYQGAFILDRIDQTDEKNAKPLSLNINGNLITNGLLDETKSNLQSCSSVDFDRKYWLAISNTVYMWDYEISPYYDTGNYEESQRRLSWWIHDNVYSSSWFINNQTLYYGRSDEGSITKLDDTFRDYGEAISCYWQSKAFDFNMPQYQKTIYEIIVGLRSDTNTLLTIEYLDEKKNKIDSKTVIVGNFSYEIPRFSYEAFTYAFNRYAQQKRFTPKCKKIVYFSIKLSNNTAGRDLGITDLTMILEKNGRIR